MSNRKKIPERKHPAPKMLVAGALGSAAVMAITASALEATTITPPAPVTSAASASPVDASLTGYTTPAVTIGGITFIPSITFQTNPGTPTGALQPGGTGSITGQVAAPVLPLPAGPYVNQTTSQDSAGSTSTERQAGLALGGGGSVQFTPEGPSPDGAHAGVVVGGGFDVPIPGAGPLGGMGTIGASFEVKVDAAPLFTGGPSGSQVTATVSNPIIPAIFSTLGYPNFAAGTGVGATLQQDNQGNVVVSFYPVAAAGLDAEAKLGLFGSYTTPAPPGTGSTAAPLADQGVLTGNAQGFQSAITPAGFPQSFAEMTYMPPASAGFDNATTTTAIPPVLSGSGPTLQQMMTIYPQGPANWPDAQSTQSAPSTSAPSTQLAPAGFPQSFAEMTYMPPASAGFNAATTTTAIPPVLSGDGPTLQQMMTIYPQGPANWPAPQQDGSQSTGKSSQLDQPQQQTVASADGSGQQDPGSVKVADASDGDTSTMPAASV